MRVCHVTSVHPRHDIRICEKECASLAGKGYDVFLVVDDTEADEVYKGIHIISTGEKARGRLSRITKAPRRVLKKAIEVNADIYQLHDPELLSISDILLRAGKKVIFDAHEDTEKQIETKHYIPIVIRPLVGKIYGFYSHGKLKRMTALISVTPSIVNKLRKYNDNVAMVTNYPIIGARFNSEEKRLSNTINKNSNKKKVKDNYVFFAGGIMEQWCHESIIEAVKKVVGVTYLYAGKGRSEYLSKLQMWGTDHRYLGLLSHDEVMKYYKGAIAGMAVLKADTQVGKDGTLGNTKLFEVMEAGRPVICSDLKIWRDIIERYNCGICVTSENPSSIADAIRYLSEHPDKGNEMGLNGRRAVEEEFNWSIQEQELFALYEKIARLP